MDPNTTQSPMPQQPEIVAPPQPHKSHALVMGLAGVVLLGLGLLGGYFLFANKTSYQAPSQTAYVSPMNVSEIPTNTPSNDSTTVNWKTYTIESVHMSFKLPPKMASLGNLKETVEILPAGFTGKQLCMTFPERTGMLVRKAYAGGGCSQYGFGIGTISVDYNAGRGVGFLDMQGFIYKNGKYYARFLGKEVELPSTTTKKIKNLNGVEIITIVSVYAATDSEPLPPIYNTGMDKVGALVNTKDISFPGLAVLMDTRSGLQLDEFEKILSTFKFTN